MGAAAMITRRIMQETGKPLQEAVAEVPAELEKFYTELKAKTLEFMQTGPPVDEDAGQDAAGDLSESGTGRQ